MGRLEGGCGESCGRLGRVTGKVTGKLRGGGKLPRRLWECFERLHTARLREACGEVTEGRLRYRESPVKLSFSEKLEGWALGAQCSSEGRWFGFCWVFFEIPVSACLLLSTFLNRNDTGGYK